MGKLYMVLGAIFAIVAACGTSFYVGWTKRGEVEAGRTALALEQAINEEAEKQKKKMEIAIKNIEAQKQTEVETKHITAEVQKHVKNMDSDPICFGAAELQLVTKANQAP